MMSIARRRYENRIRLRLTFWKLRLVDPWDETPLRGPPQGLPLLSEGLQQDLLLRCDASRVEGPGCGHQESGSEVGVKSQEAAQEEQEVRS